MVHAIFFALARKFSKCYQFSEEKNHFFFTLQAKKTTKNSLTNFFRHDVIWICQLATNSGSDNLPNFSFFTTKLVFMRSSHFGGDFFSLPIKYFRKMPAKERRMSNEFLIFFQQLSWQCKSAMIDFTILFFLIRLTDMSEFTRLLIFRKICLLKKWNLITNWRKKMPLQVVFENLCMRRKRR